MSTSEVFSAPPSISSACPVIVPANLLALRPAKIRDHHLLRKAVVYIRQSSPQQVAEHKESTARRNSGVSASFLPEKMNRLRITRAKEKPVKRVA
ncbi:MAG: hypothetical protein ACLP53_03600 [Isosphaeraceae bacterium]